MLQTIKNSTAKRLIVEFIAFLAANILLVFLAA
jgi:hypothetical protein